MADLCLSCCMNEQDMSQRVKSREIDKTLNKERLIYRRTVRILLLGAGESGKSTFLKQMRIIHGEEFDDDTIREYKTTIYNNTIKGMRVLIDARYKLDIPWGDKSCAQDADFVFAFDINSYLDESTFLLYVRSLRKLWVDSGIRTAFDRRREFQLVGT